MAMKHHFIKKIKIYPLKKDVHLQWKLEVDVFLCLPGKEDSHMSIKKLIVYICSPYAGDIKANVENARRYCRFAADSGYIPMAPHLLFPQFLDDTNPKERELGLEFGKAIIEKCSEVWVFGKHISSGMEAEINLAKQNNYRLRYFTDKCQEV
ncbi:hypothetical protein JY782_11735 [Clostridioides difficile]|uniref:DUF7768 domain-containing protein n=2 Tax=Absicoccus porci TaxID=2486576 RepID=A0A3N0HY45_9FIRM|nr:hypothetical protein [Clostridioides difficile]RNM29052.1 hypothetical protein EDX97_11540 [Absicoccus porci]MCJ0380974.1 hypothetical protein [Clostridioides difficile]MDB0376622.1 hypothetical protein [Clostridioides difficile]MDB0394942.1 hypothetical protein [Clostridioides difficile]